MKKIILLLILEFVSCGALDEYIDKKVKNAYAVDNRVVALWYLEVEKRRRAESTTALPICVSGSSATFSNAMAAGNSRALNYDDPVSFKGPASSSGSVFAYCGFTFDPRNKSSIQVEVVSSSLAGFSVLVSNRLLTFSTDALRTGFSTSGTNPTSVTLTGITPTASATNPWYIYLVQNNSTSCPTTGCNYVIKITGQ